MKEPDDLAAMSPNELRAEVIRLRGVIAGRLERVQLGLIEGNAQQAKTIETLIAADATLERLMAAVRVWPWFCLFAWVVGIAIGLAAGVWL